MLDSRWVVGTERTGRQEVLSPHCCVQEGNPTFLCHGPREQLQPLKMKSSGLTAVGTPRSHS